MKSRGFVYIALFSDIAIAIAKFVAVYFTKSPSMVAEGIHSIVDSISQVLLIWGIVASNKQPDENRPFGYGKELYFWSFIVSLMIFILGGCISIYEGITRLWAPQVLAAATWSYGVLAIAFVFTTISMFSSLKVFNTQRGDISFWQAISRSKDPTVFIVLLGDIGDLVGLLVAFAGVWLCQLLHKPVFDAIASMVIGGIMLGVSFILVRESKSLLMGEAISKKILNQIVALVESDEAVAHVQTSFSMYLGPNEAILQLKAIFDNELTTPEITDAISRIIRTVQAKYPRIKQMFIEPVNG